MITVSKDRYSEYQLQFALIAEHCNGYKRSKDVFYKNNAIQTLVNVAHNLLYDAYLSTGLQKNNVAHNILYQFVHISEIIDLVKELGVTVGAGAYDAFKKIDYMRDAVSSGNGKSVNIKTVESVTKNIQDWFLQTFRA